jgi:hypothetical protein
MTGLWNAKKGGTAGKRENGRKLNRKREEVHTRRRKWQ